MVSLSAEEDRANLKHKAALRAQLEATVLHLLRVAVAHPEAEPDPEPEPESEATIDDPKGEIDTESPSVRDCCFLSCFFGSQSGAFELH